jgi:hypothetical protein
MDGMAMRGDQRAWVRRLTLAVVLVTCAGGAAFVLIGRPHSDCAVVADMMATYTDFQAATAPAASTGMTEQEDLVASAEAESEAAETLHRQARDIRLPELRSAAVTFADTVASSAEAQLDAAARPEELDPFDAVLPEVDPAELRAGEKFTAAAHILLVACPAVPHPFGMS